MARGEGMGRTYNQFRLAHQSVNKKNAARTREATLLALMLNPHAMREAPMNEEPRYPAGRVMMGTPPDMRVAPPSSAAPISNFELHCVGFGEANVR